jgi:hypothetical protein
MERQKFIEEMKSEATEKISLKIQENNNENNNNDIYDDEVNIDDI